MSKIKDFLFDRFYPDIYRSACRQAVIPGRVLFVEYRTDSIPDSFRLLREQLSGTGQADIHFLALNRSRVSYPEFVRRSVRLVREMALAEYVFLSDINEVVSCLPKRPETKVIQLWHACGAFKKFGRSTAENDKGVDLDWISRHPLYGNLDYVTASSKEVIPFYADAMGISADAGVIIPTGVSRTDVYFRKDLREISEARFYEMFPFARGRKVILYAPTFRGRTPNTWAPRGFDIPWLLERIDPEYVVAVRHHALSRAENDVPEKANRRDDRIIDASRLPIEEVLCMSDICITDYSSLIFEYSLFTRPMLFFADDLDEYRKWNGFYFDYEKTVPGPVCRNMEDVAASIANISQAFDPQTVIRFRERFMSACDGHATERIAALVLEHR